LPYQSAAGNLIELEKLKKSFELRYLMPTGYQMEQEKRDKRFDLRNLIPTHVSDGARKTQEEF
jgi:hypothetical protein